MRRTYAFFAIALLLVADLAAAQTDDGIAAYRRGDYAVARAAWQIAAGEGDTTAQYGLALLYRDGKGVQQDSKRAFEYLTHAAQGGFVKAQVALALMYETGHGAQRSPEAAARWQESAALQGHVPSQIRLAERYLAGNGVTSSPFDAYVWLSIAVTSTKQQHVARAGELLAQTQGRLTKEEIERARRRADEMHPRIVDAARAAVADAARDGSETARRARVETSMALPRPPRRGGGTGFVVDDEGHLLTSYHVVRGCRSIRVGPQPTSVEAMVVGYDEQIDLALLKPSSEATAYARLSNRPLRLAESILVFGFPLPGVLASSGNASTGIVSALVGIGDDETYFQLSAPIQHGNSGAAVLNRYGEVTGVVVRKLDAVRLAEQNADMPHNVAFAVKLEPLRRFLERHGVRYKTNANGQAINAPGIVERAQTFTFRVQCFE